MPIIKSAFLGLFLTSTAAIAQPGTIDPSFGGGPVVVGTGAWGPNAAGSGFGTLNRVIVQSTGNVVALGKCNNLPRSGFGAIRFNLDGSVDGSFGQAGTAGQPYTNAAGTAYIAPYNAPGQGTIAGAVGPGDRIIMADDCFQLVCVTASGTLDASFGSGGRLSMYSLGKRYWTSTSLAIQPDGKIVIAGYSIPQSGHNNTYDVTVARLNPNGSLDTTFANTGHGSTPGYFVDAQPGDQYMARGTMALQADGKIVLASISSNSQATIARYLTNGALDTTFGVGGKRAYSFSGGHDGARGLAITTDGRIILEAVQGQTVYLARYTSSGALDPSFGGFSSGWTSIVLPVNAGVYYGIALQADNSVVIPLAWPDGTVDGNGSAQADQAAFRFTPGGLADTAFGPWGSGLSQLAGWPGQYEHTRAVTVDPFGRIIMAGSHYDGTTGGIMVTAIRSQ